MRVEPSTSRPLSTEPSPRRAGGSGYSIADSAKHAWIDALGDRLDDLALAGAAAVLEETTQTFRLFATTHSCSLTGSACSFASSRSQAFPVSLSRDPDGARSRFNFRDRFVAALQHLPCLAITSYTCSTRKARAG